MNLVIIDIDGTIADIRARMQKAGMQPNRDNRKEFQAWLDRLQTDEMLAEDPPIPGMLGFVQALDFEHILYYVTGRDEKYRKVTEDWLDKHGFPPAIVHMRPSQDTWLAPGDYKQSVIRKLNQQHEGPVIVVDDDADDTLEPVCRENGWTLLKVVV
jgi:hypothetical protein